MANLNKTNKVLRRSYRPEQKACPICQHFLKRSHILWRKLVYFSAGPEVVVSWAYRCENGCEEQSQTYFSRVAEKLHLKHRRFSREMVVKIGYRRFWHHQTMYELHDWLTQDLQSALSERQVLNLIADFLALLRVGQAAKIRAELGKLKYLVVGIDGTQPEKGNKSLYIVREIQSGVTLVAESLDEGLNGTLRERLFEVEPPFALGGPIQVLVKRRLHKGRVKHSYYVTTLTIPSKKALMARYNQRGGAEIEQFRTDKSALHLSARRKQSLAAPKALILLTDLVHNPNLQAIVQQVANATMGRPVQLPRLSLIHLPEYNFVHGGCLLNGRVLTILYFEDIQKGLLILAHPFVSDEVKYTRFTGHTIIKPPDPSLN